MDHSGNPLFVDRPESGDREAERDKPFFLWNPKAFCLQVRQKAAVGATGDFQADPFLFLGDTAVGIAAAELSFSSSKCAVSCHKIPKNNVDLS